MSPADPARPAAPDLSVVMPAHNEAGLLEQTLKVLVSALRERSLAFEPVSYTHLTLPTNREV